MKLTQLHPNAGQIKGVPRNPRQITDAEFRKLKNSIVEFRQMLEARPIIVDENLNILGGNMRYEALCKLAAEGAKAGAFVFSEDIPDDWVKMMPNWSERQKREFVIKDNNEFGEYDWDLVANEWSDEPLQDWGVDLPTQENSDKKDLSDALCVEYKVEISCTDELQQEQLYTELTERGLECRILTL